MNNSPATQKAIELVKKVAAGGMIPDRFEEQCIVIAQELQNEMPHGLEVILANEPAVLPWAWCNEDNLEYVYKRHPEWRWSAAWSASYTEEGVRGIGYPGKIYASTEEFLVDTACIRNIIQPDGGTGLGGTFWFKKIADPDKWWTQVARPHYIELFRSKEKADVKAAERLANLTKEAIERRSFPFNAR